MRTTVSIDDDVLAAVNEVARRERRAVGAVLSELARQALARGREASRADSFLEFEPFPRRGPAVSNDMVDALRELELG